MSTKISWPPPPLRKVPFSRGQDAKRSSTRKKKEKEGNFGGLGSFTPLLLPHFPTQLYCPVTWNILLPSFSPLDSKWSKQLWEKVLLSCYATIESLLWLSLLHQERHFNFPPAPSPSENASTHTHKVITTSWQHLISRNQGEDAGRGRKFY